MKAKVTLKEFLVFLLWVPVVFPIFTLAALWTYYSEEILGNRLDGK